MKTFLLVFLLLAIGCLAVQMFFFLAHQIERRTRPWHEREADSDQDWKI